MHFEVRFADFLKILSKHPDRVPVIVEKSEGSMMPDLDKPKYFVPATLTVSAFIYTIRVRLNLAEEKDLSFLIKKKVITDISNTMETIYSEYEDEDGFLYIAYS
ncbi:MAG: hypothetical protein F6K36_06775 [Symploca sp. SIO3C6]|uniref:Autophagy-related protein n=1 Tax=Symploca sp. SIO1C4 TaxID=2607765 RepID=A0A6B3NDY0_9CYAN|nr:hypothetical protein [Symploca sp. SIO3C6]NER27348.1 hypothetical protein [Symploca sp. SIO1C4]